MKFDQRLTRRQKRVLRAYRDGDKTLEQICKKFKYRPWLLSKWIEQRLFRNALTKVHSTLERRARLETDRAIPRATEVVARALTRKTINAQELKLAGELLKFHFGRLQWLTSRKASKPPYPLPIHPAISLDEARELMLRMNGNSSER